MIDTTPDRVTEPAPQAPLTNAEKTALLERIVSSAQFRRAARLRELLQFVGERSIRSSAPIHELEIGSAVFERPAGYDTGIDNIVRVNATELRKRLELYFSAEGAHEPVVVEMPRGSYSLVFHARPPQPEVAEAFAAGTPAEPTPPDTPNEPVLPPSATRRLEFWRVVALLLLPLCAGLLWQDLRLRREVSPWREGTALRAFWSEFFDSGQEVDIVLADTSFAQAEDIEGRSIPLASYLNYDYKRIDTVPGLSPDRRADLLSVLNRNNGSMGDFIVARRILGLERSGPALQLKFAREYSPEAIKTNNVILIGSRQSNPWVELFDPRMNFSMDYDPARHQSSVHNRQPRAGEDAVYARAGDLAHNAGLSVIAFMPALSGQGSTLIIAGTDSQATRAAGEFVTSDSSLKDFLGRIGSQTFPYFEILLENSQLTGTPLHSQILAYRVYPRNGSGGAASSRAEQAR